MSAVVSAELPQIQISSDSQQKFGRIRDIHASSPEVSVDSLRRVCTISRRGACQPNKSPSFSFTHPQLWWLPCVCAFLLSFSSTPIAPSSDTRLIPLSSPIHFLTTSIRVARFTLYVPHQHVKSGQPSFRVAHINCDSWIIIIIIIISYQSRTSLQSFHFPSTNMTKYASSSLCHSVSVR